MGWGDDFCRTPEMMKGELLNIVSMNNLDLLKVVGEFYSQPLICLSDAWKGSKHIIPNGSEER